MARQESSRAPSRRDRRALTCCVAAALMLAGALALVLSDSAQRRSGTNGVFPSAQVGLAAGTTACQAGELLPDDTVAVQIAGTAAAPPVVVIRRDGRVLGRTEATVEPRAAVITAPIERTDRALHGVQVCVTMRAPGVLLRGPTPPGVGTLVAGRPVAGSSLAIGYAMSGRHSWWGFAATLAERISGNHGHGGLSWVIWATVGLLVASLVLTGRIVWRTLVLERSMPRLGLAIAAVAVLNATAWSLITPLFQVPDEVAHVAYAQSLGETGRPPAHPPALLLSPEQAAAMTNSGFGQVASLTYRAAAWSRQQESLLVPDAMRRLSRQQIVPAGEAEPEPPLYYALEAIPYRVAHDGTLVDRILLMRLASALLAGATALLSFLFIRECLPAKPWAWTVGGLGIALSPMLGFIAGGVNPDGLLFALAAGLFLCVARAWRRGATMRLALILGALIAAGMLTKVNFYGLVPGTLLGFALAARRTTLAWDRRLVRMVGGAALLAGGLFAAGAAFEALVWHRSLLAARPVAPESHVGLWSHVGYIWQVLLPRLPFQPQTALSEPGYEQLFKSFIGAFGQMVAWFPSWVYQLAAVGLGSLVLLTVRVLHADPREVRWRRGELLGYTVTAATMLLMVGLSADLRRHLVAIVQGRYLLPLLPLLGVLLTLGARGAGERWGRPVGVAIVSGAVAWSLFGQLLTIAWFYS